MRGSRKNPDLEKKNQVPVDLESYYKTIFENTGTANVLIGENAFIEAVNSEFKRLTGYSEADLEGKKWTDIIAADDSRRVETYHYRRVVDPSSAPRNYEFKFLKKDGNVGIAFITIAVIPGTKMSMASFIDITERKNTEKALKLSQERYRAIVEDQKDMIARFLPDGTLTFVNEAYCKFFGVDKEEIIGSSFFEFLSKDGRERIEQFLDSIDRKNYREMNEDIWKYPDGNLRWIQWNYGVIFKDNCVIAEIQASGRDVTDINESERKLEESEKKFRAIAETAKDAIFLAETSGKIVFCNEAALFLYGYRRDELIERNVSILVPEEYMNDFGKGFENCDALDKNYSSISNIYELQGLRKDGTRFPIDISLSMWSFDENVYVTAIVRDITPRVEAEKRIKFQANILENVQDSVIVTDLHGTIKYWNKGSEAIFGYSLEEAVGKTMALVCPGREEQIEKVLNHVMRVNECIKEHECRRKDGSRVWADTRTTKMFDLNGNVQGFLNVSKDITERKKIQDEINASLKEKKMLLDEINIRVGNYIQMISALIKFQWYVDSKMNEEMSRDRKNRIDAVLLIHDGISQSNDFATIDFSKYMHKLVKNVIRSYNVKSMGIEIMVEGLLLDIETAVPCGLILNEILTNSIKHAFFNGKKGKICIDFKRYNGDSVLSVKDNGVKFSEDVDFNTDKHGLKFLNLLVDMLNGELSFKFDDGNLSQVKFKEY